MSMPNTPLADRITVFERAATYALETLDEVSATDLDRPTPCEAWDVRDVVLHLADVADAVIDLTVTGELVMPTPRSSVTPGPVAVAQQRIESLREKLTTMGVHNGQADLLLGAAQGGANELAAHGWDISMALGLDHPIPDDTATDLLALIKGDLDNAARGTKFAPAQPIALAAAPSDLFVAYLGRRPREPVADPGCLHGLP